VIQINICLLIFCHQWCDNFSAPNETINVWQLGSTWTHWGADSAANNCPQLKIAHKTVTGASKVQ